MGKNILVACEESQAVTKELRRLGHKAYSCDIIDQSGGHPEWHIMQDVLPLINGRCEFRTTDGAVHKIEGRWDALICFPPCTDIANSGAKHFAKKRADGRQRKSVLFFCQFLAADCGIIVIENPVGIISGEYVRTHFPDLAEKYNLPRKPTQIIQPWQFALTDEEMTEKSTCVWIIGGRELVPIRTEKPDIQYFEWIAADGKMKRQTLWYYKTRCLPYEQRGRAASKTFPGFARAIAEQIIGPSEKEEEIMNNAEQLERREGTEAKPATVHDFNAAAQLKRLADERKALANINPDSSRFSDDVRALEYAINVLEVVGL